VVLKDRAAQNAAEWQAQQKAEDLKNEFAGRIAALNRWVQNANEVSSEPIAVNTPEEVKALQDAFLPLYCEIPGKTADRDDINRENESLVAQGITENPLAESSVSELSANFDDAVNHLHARKADLEAEAARQEANDALSKRFAGAADAISAKLDSQLVALQGLSGDIQNQLGALSNIHLDEGPVRDLFALDQQVQEAGVRFNRHTNLTAESVNAKFKALADSIDDKRKMLEGELLTKQHGEVPSEQLQEIRECFAKFDKDHNGTLARHEFKACLSALGEDISDAALDALMATHGQNTDHGIVLSLDNFTAFMINRLKDTDTEQQIIDSFKALCHDRPFITEQELRLVFREEENFQYLLTQIPKTSDGSGYDYVAYTKNIFSR